METKKSIVKSVGNNFKSYESKFGKMFCHQIEFENGDSGEYHSTKDVCEFFVKGQEAQYTHDIKHNGKYVNHIIKPFKESAPFAKSIKDPAADKYKQALIVAQSCMTKAVELCIAGKIKDEQIKPATERFTGYVYEIADKYGKEASNG
jgi:hypothetical protein